MSRVAAEALLLFAAVLVAQMIPFNSNSLYLLLARVAFLSVHISGIVTYVVLAFHVRKVNDTTKVRYISKAQGNIVATTVCDYDLVELSSGMSRVVVVLAAITALHMYTGLTSP